MSYHPSSTIILIATTVYIKKMLAGENGYKSQNLALHLLFSSAVASSSDFCCNMPHSL